MKIQTRDIKGRFKKGYNERLGKRIHSKIVSCKNCNKKFYSFNHTVWGWRKYCSQKCYQVYKSAFGLKNREKSPCLICGKVIIRPITYSRNLFISRKKICSKQCLSIFQKNNWQNEDYAKLQLKASGIKPNKMELKLGKILGKNWQYVGNGEVWFGGKNPDFININGQKKLVELFGDFWHKPEDEQFRINHFEKFGFETIIIWDKELKNLDKLKEKISNFISIT